MAVVLREIFKVYHRWVNVEIDQRVMHFPLVSSPLPVVSIVALYLLFVKKWGPAYMKNRRPFQIERLIQVYNILQILACSYLTGLGLWYLYGPWGHYNFWCEPVNYSSTHPLTDKVLGCTYLYFLLKLSDLLDTVFFVLRKKDSHISFLHVYHHAGMVLLSWVGLRYVAGGSNIFIGWLNSFVHAVMYTYYFLTSWDPKYKNNVGWKKYLTQFQLFQFFMFSLYAVQLIIRQHCPISVTLPFVFLLPQNLFMLLMFLDFYRKNYL